MRARVIEEISRQPPVASLDLFPELAACAGHSGGANHDEDVLTHLSLACGRVPKSKPLLRLAALLHDIGKPSCWKDGHFRGHDKKSVEIAAPALKRLGFSEAEIAYVAALIKVHMLNVVKMKPTRLKARLLELEKAGASWKDFLLLRFADKMANLKLAGKKPDLRQFAKACRRALSLPSPGSRDLAVNGRDVMEILGIAQGPEVGRMLADLDNIVKGGFPNDRERLLGWLRARKS